MTYNVEKSDEKREKTLRQSPIILQDTIYDSISKKRGFFKRSSVLYIMFVFYTSMQAQDSDANS
jgi:hypothetical protein